MYVNDMVALEKDILMALDKQKEDERVQSDPRTSALIAQIYDTTKAHRSSTARSKRRACASARSS